MMVDAQPPAAMLCRLIVRSADIHFAPTQGGKSKLRRGRPNAIWRDRSVVILHVIMHHPFARLE